MKVFFAFVIAAFVYQASGFVLEAPEPMVEDHDACDTCKSFFEYVREKVEDNETRKDVVDYIEEHVCDKVTILRIKPFCMFVTRIFVGPTLRALANGVEPQAICEDIEFCEIPEGSDLVENNLFGWRDAMKTLKEEFLK